jgi:O-6-methylguanine DNA methyltransferase
MSASISRKSFKELVYEVVRNIPKGKTLSYKEVANMVGRPRSYRAVGNVLNMNYDKKIPCHRVVRSDGTAGGYNRGKSKKVAILKREGVNL